MGGKAVLTLACLWDSSPATGLPHSALVCWYVPGLVVACYTMFG